MPQDLRVAQLRYEELLNARRRRLTGWIIAAVVVALGGWAFAIAGYDVSRVSTSLLSPKSAEFLLQSILSVLLGVFSALAFSAFENRTYKAALNRLYDAGPLDLVDEAIALLEHHRSLVYDYKVEYHLSPSPIKGMLILHVRFSYKKVVSDRNLYFRLMRLKTREEQVAFETSQASVDALYGESELFFYFPEVELRGKFGDDAVESAFAFEYLKLDGTSVKPAALPTDANTFHIRVPDQYSISDPLPMEYSFRYAVSTSDIVFCMAEFPTKGVEIRFTRDGEVRTSISVDALELMSATIGNATVSEDSLGTHSVSHPGWVLPKSGAVFHWYPTK